MKYLLLIFLLFPLNLFSQNIGNEYFSPNIEEDFIGVYLPDEYINSLIETRNHSISMHLNDRNNYRDVLAVNRNIIYSNLKWHDQYAIRAVEGINYQFIRNGVDYKIIDNNGFSYTKIGDDPTRYTTIATTFIGNIWFSNLINNDIGVSINERMIEIPFFYAFLNEVNFEITINDMFFERDASILLYNRNRRMMLYAIIENDDYLFYSMERRSPQSPYTDKTDNIIVRYNLNDDMRITYAMSGLSENFDVSIINNINKMEDFDRRIIINSMFALNGYVFTTEQWQIFFRDFWWYLPNINIRNDAEILNIRQKRLLEFLRN